MLNIWERLSWVAIVILAVTVIIQFWREDGADRPPDSPSSDSQSPGILQSIQQLSGEIAGLSYDVEDLSLEIKRCRPDFLATFPLVFENARFDGDGKLSTSSHGIQLTPHDKQHLKSLIKAFTPCAARFPVRLTVAGHSSSASFVDTNGNPLPATDQLNLQVANLRANVVVEYLTKASADFEVGWERWPTYKAMVRPYLDNPKFFGGDRDREALNRSVFIHLRDAGGCDIRRPASDQ